MPNPKSPGDPAGFSLASSKAHPDNESQLKSQQSLASRAIALSSYFLSGALCINLSQFLGTPLYLINQDWYNAWIAFTKQSFGLLTMTLTQAFSPTRVIVSGDQSVRGQLLCKSDGTLHLDFPDRLVLIANHQIYTDWLYLWWTAYCSGMHGRLYIILKESLKKIPIIGWGMQFNQFIFLKRNWEQDREQMAQALKRLNKLADPMWLLLFPEGTNLARSTREKSAKWAEKNKMKDTKHCLLPRSTGLRFCLQELKDTVDYLYDCTIAYEGVPRGSFAQDIFTLRSGYLEGKPPKSVSMYWRRFAIKDIPIHNDKAFELWLIARWREKDLLIENYLIHGHFPADTGISRTPQGKLTKGAGHLNVEIRSSHWYEFLQIFAPMGILAMVLYIFYGAIPQKFFKSETGKAVKESTADLQTLKTSVKPPTMPESFNLDSIFDKDKQTQTFGNSGVAFAQWMQTPEAKRMADRADLVQRWVQDPQKMLVESLVGNTDKKPNYLNMLKEEESRRKKLVNKHQGTFWKDLEGAEMSTAVSRIGKPPAGTFYKELEQARTAKGLPSLTQANLKKRTRFWDDLEQESNKRAGTVLTLPTLSTSTSATPMASMNSSSTVVASSTKASTAPKQNAKQSASSVKSSNPTASKSIKASNKPLKLPNSINSTPKKSALVETKKSGLKSANTRPTQATAPKAKPVLPTPKPKPKPASTASTGSSINTQSLQKKPPKLKSKTAAL